MECTNSQIICWSCSTMPVRHVSLGLCAISGPFQSHTVTLQQASIHNHLQRIVPCTNAGRDTNWLLQRISPAPIGQRHCLTIAASASSPRLPRASHVMFDSFVSGCYTVGKEHWVVQPKITSINCALDPALSDTHDIQ